MVANLMAEVTQTSTDAACGALVSHVQRGAEVRNVEVRQTLALNSTFAAGIAGVNDGSIDNCRVTATGAAFTNYGGVAYRNNAGGSITGCEFIMSAGATELTAFGGFVCENSGIISDCRSYLPESDVTLAGSNVGGGVSLQTAGSVTNCQTVFHSKGMNASAVGGMIGLVTGGAVSDCSTNGKLVSGSFSVGGLIGMVDASANVTIENCTSSVALVEGDSTVGGLIGYVRLHSFDVTVKNCISDSSVKSVPAASVSTAGGILGDVTFWEDGDGTAEFTMTGCNSYGLSVTGVGSNVGGAVGLMNGKQANSSFYIEDCTANSNASGHSGVGGFVGSMSGSATGRSGATIENCSATGSTTSTAIETGGFIGSNRMNGSLIKSCKANGSTIARDGDGTYVGRSAGFVGYAGFQETDGTVTFEDCEAAGNSIGGTWDVGGFVGRTDKAVYKNCVSSGNLTVEECGQSGGFMGYAGAVTVENCVASGNFKSVGACSNIGGFAGQVLQQSSFRNCTAYGNINASSNIGGFVGMISAVNAGENVSFNDCAAYGNVTGTPNISTSSGGFVGFIIIAGSVSFTDCEAYGNVDSSRSGGFVGCIDSCAEARFQRCTAYGDVYNYGTSLEAGGFCGFFFRGKGVFWDCTAYGNVYNMAAESDNDTSGFLAVSFVPFDMRRCASYSKTVTGTHPQFVGGLIGSLNGGTITGSVIEDCEYVTPANIVGSISPDLPGYGVTVSGNSQITDTAEIPANPKKSVSCAVTSTADGVNIDFTNFVNFAAGTTVTDLQLSVDEGKNYTQLVYNNRTLVKLGANAIGGSLPAVDFSYLYSTRVQYNVSVVRVRVVFSDGFTVTFN